MVRKTLLDSGVHVVSERIAAVNSVAAGLWVSTGSRDEPAPLAGITHLVEHMVFKGTRRRRMHHIARRLESVGGYLNAFTAKEYTCFETRALEEHLVRSIDTVADLVTGPQFPEHELSNEKGVVLEEMKMYADTPDDVVLEHFEDIVYAGHALAHPVLGNADTVLAVSRSDLVDWLEQRYTPDRIVVAASGNVKHEALVRAARRALVDLRESRGMRTRTAVGRYVPQRREVLRPISQAHMVMGCRGLSVHHPKRAALIVLRTILGGGMSSRLNQNIREKYGFCYNVSAFLNMYSDTGDFGVYMGVDPAAVDKAERLIRREYAKLASRPVSARMLKHSKNQIRGALLIGLENVTNRMARIARQEIFFGKQKSIDRTLEELGSVQAQDVQDLAASLLKPKELSCVVVLPAPTS